MAWWISVASMSLLLIKSEGLITPESINTVIRGPSKNLAQLHIKSKPLSFTGLVPFLRWFIYAYLTFNSVFISLIEIFLLLEHSISADVRKSPGGSISSASNAPLHVGLSSFLDETPKAQILAVNFINENSGSTLRDIGCRRDNTAHWRSPQKGNAPRGGEIYPPWFNIFHGNPCFCLMATYQAIDA